MLPLLTPVVHLKQDFIMNMNEEAVRNVVFNVGDVFRGCWLNADELVEILGWGAKYGRK